MDQWPTLLADACFGWLAAMAGGILVPFSREQPLASGVTGFVVFLLYAGSTGAAHWAGPELGSFFGDDRYLGDVVSTVALILLLALVVFVSARRVTKSA
jgi:hypothetical protein